MNSQLVKFIETGLWATQDYFSKDEKMLDAEFSADQVSDRFKKAAVKFINEFCGRAGHLFDESEIERGRIEHDLWLTVEGHGAGFWDGDYKNGDAITEIVESMGFHDNYWSELLNESVERGLK